VTTHRPSDGLPARIALLRTRLGLAQRAFAARVGVTRNIVIKWERGHHWPSSRALERIAAAGGVTVDWLLRGHGRPPRVSRHEPELEAAMARLRAAWREPGWRAQVLRVLRERP
jgi:transcriptional regulator with XRE-family HTH domain